MAWQTSTYRQPGQSVVFLNGISGATNAVIRRVEIDENDTRWYTIEYWLNNEQKFCVIGESDFAQPAS